MRRRTFLGTLLTAAIFPPAAVLAQQKPMPVIGFLAGTSPVGYASFREGLGEAGFVEGRNVAIEYRWAEGAFDRLPAMAEDLVRRHVDIIVASGGTLAAAAAKKATDTVPIVFIVGNDPVAGGLVASLAHPGGNLTGLSFLVTDLNTKRFGLLCELVPQARRVGLIVNPRNPVVAERTLHEIGAVASRKGIALILLQAGSVGEIEATFAALAERHAEALLIGNDPFFNSQRERFVRLAARYRLSA
ncbi:MAG TPA: ABC transporter substrate-binding protein, partial [Stellaceae bacterium]